MEVETINTSQRSASTNDLIEKTLHYICGIDDANNPLSEALKYHFISGGSRTRANLTYKFAKNFLIAEERCLYLACIPELLHNASLIHDDLQDLDDERRDHLSVWKKFGSDIAICAGDFLISAAYSCLSYVDTKKTALLAGSIHAHVHTIITGQIKDLSLDKNQTLSDTTTYEDISSKKSGPLLAMTLTLPLIYTDRSMFVETAEQAFYHFAIAYQIYDDIHDIKQDQAKKGIKPGLNILSIMELASKTCSLKAACDLALDNLSRASELSSKLPFPSNRILDSEIEDMRRKLSIVGSR